MMRRKHEESGTMARRTVSAGILIEKFLIPSTEGSGSPLRSIACRWDESQS